MSCKFIGSLRSRPRRVVATVTAAALVSGIGTMVSTVAPSMWVSDDPGRRFTTRLQVPIETESGHERSLGPDVYDAGEVLAGTTIRHQFVIRNDSANDWSIGEGEPVQSSCGCSQATLAVNWLRSSEATTLDVTVRTDAKRGPMWETVNVPWRCSDGTRVNQSFAVAADVLLPIEFDPPELVFSTQDVRHRTTKTVRCRSDLPVDWSRANVLLHEDHLEIVDQRISPDRQTLELGVTVVAACRGAARQTTLQIGVPPGTPQHQLTEGHGDDRLVGTLPVYSTHPVLLECAPEFAAVKYDPASDCWKTRLILKGDALRDHDPSIEIHSEWGEPRHRLIRISADMIRIDLGISGDGATCPERFPVEIQTAQDQRLRVVLCRQL